MAQNGTKRKTKATVVSQKQIGEQIFDLWLSTDLAGEARPGQFVGLYPADGATLLPRPISVCEAEAGRLRLVYRIAGKGTAAFSALRAGDEVSLLGMLGNGFPLEKAAGRRTLLIGGGIGIPPMLELAKRISGEKHILLGFRGGTLFLRDEFVPLGQVYVATEDGSAGTKGNVMDIIAAEGLPADVIMACGPLPMLRAIKAYAAEQGIEAYISLEERMACGVGACLGCVCKTAEKDAHSHVNNARICTEGPVFEAREVEI